MYINHYSICQQMRADQIASASTSELPKDGVAPPKSPNRPARKRKNMSPRLDRRTDSVVQPNLETSETSNVVPDNTADVSPSQTRRSKKPSRRQGVVVTSPRTKQEKSELLEYFTKLQVLVPSLPKNGDIEKIDIIEHVIGYIRQLETNLADHPMRRRMESSAIVSKLLQGIDINRLINCTRQANISIESSDFVDYSRPPCPHNRYGGKFGQFDTLNVDNDVSVSDSSLTYSEDFSRRSESYDQSESMDGNSNYSNLLNDDGNLFNSDSNTLVGSDDNTNNSSSDQYTVCPRLPSPSRSPKAKRPQHRKPFGLLSSTEN